MGVGMGPHEKINAIRDVDFSTFVDATDPPTEECYELAHQLMTLILKYYKAPKDIGPTAVGGICFAWYDKELYADIEVYNDGEMAAITSGSMGKEKMANNIDVWTIDVLPFDLLITLQKISSLFSDEIY